MNVWLWFGLPAFAIGYLFTWASVPNLGPLLLIVGWTVALIGIGHALG